MTIDQDALLALGERIAENAAHLDAAMHRLLVDIRQFDADGGHFWADFKSCAHWLSWRVGWDLGTARDRVRVARRLGELPMIDDALRRGELSYSKCRALVRVATAKTEEALLTCAMCSTGAQLEKICRRYQRARTSSEKAREEEDDQHRRYVSSRELDNGMVKLELVLHPDEAELAYKTMMAVAKRVSAETLSLADGAMAIFTQAASGGSTSRTPIEVVVTVPAVALTEGTDDECGELPDGTPVAAETAGTSRATPVSSSWRWMRRATRSPSDAGPGRFRSRSSERCSGVIGRAGIPDAVTTSSFTAIICGTGPTEARQRSAT